MNEIQLRTFFESSEYSQDGLYKSEGKEEDGCNGGSTEPWRAEIIASQRRHPTMVAAHAIIFHFFAIRIVVVDSNEDVLTEVVE